MNLISANSRLLKHFIFARFLLIEGWEQGALRKELIVAPFESPLKQLLWESLNGSFAGTWSNLLRHFVSVKFLLIEG